MDNRLLNLCRKKQYNTDKYYQPGRNWNPKIINDGGHPYVEHFYFKHFERNAFKAKNLLEIGTYEGGSALMWRDYMPNATITTVDLNYAQALHNQERIVQVIANAYDQSFIDLLKDSYYDYIIDDGSHLLAHMELVIQKYLTKLNDTGVLVIEDISDIQWARKMFESIPEELKNYSTLYDLREVNDRYDDIAIVIDRG